MSNEIQDVETGFVAWLGKNCDLVRANDGVNQTTLYQSAYESGWKDGLTLYAETVLGNCLKPPAGGGET